MQAGLGVDGWAECAAAAAPPPRSAGASAPPAPITCTAFDPASELLWAADGDGRVSSYFGSTLEPYTRFVAAHRPVPRERPPQRTPVSAILPDERLVFSASPRGIHAAHRRGVARWSLSTADAGVPSLRLAAMCDNAPTGPGAGELIVAGASYQLAASPSSGPAADDVLLAVAKSSGRVVNKVPSESDAPITHMRSAGRYVVSGTQSGQLQFRDPRSLKTVHRMASHPGGLIDLAAEGNLVYSVGWTIRLGHPVAEPFVKVTDMRTFRSLASVPFAAPGGPAYLAIHPRLSGTVVVAGPTGLFQIVDSGNPGQSVFHHVQTSSTVSALAMAPTGDYIVFGCQDGTVKLWSSANPDTTPGLRFNAYDSDPPVVPDLPLPPPVINWNADTPLSNVGMPFYAERLLSYTPLDVIGTRLSPLFNPPPKVDAKLISSMRSLEGKLFGQVPRAMVGKRNVVPSCAPAIGGAVPLFRSEQTKLRSGDAPSSDPPGLATDADAPAAGAGATMPPYYRTQTIQYSKFGIEDFDFGLYNKTRYSGLETHIRNSYANSLVQAMHYLYPLRHLAMAHTTIDCPREDCLLCEAGFLFRMLVDARGENCQASNLYRAFGHLPAVTHLGLQDPEAGPPPAALAAPAQVAYAHLNQKLNMFVLDTFATEAGIGPFLSVSPTDEGRDGDQVEPNLIKRLFMIRATTKSTCGTCYISGERDSSSLVCDLIYPRKALSNEVQQPSDFASVLRQSLTRPVIAKMLCRVCQTTHAAVRTRRVLGSNDSLPPLLSVHAGINSLDAFSYWLAGARMHSFASLGSLGRAREEAPSRPYLPPMFDINVVGETIDVKPVYADSTPPALYVRYVLRSMVAQVQAEKEVPHLVTFVRTSDTPAGQIKGSPSPVSGGLPPAEGQWVMFNDFLVKPVPQSEALAVHEWKVPSVLFFEKVHSPLPSPSERDADVTQLDTRIDPSILCRDFNMAPHRELGRMRHHPLLPEELPSVDAPQPLEVAIDAEFVALREEETEVHSDGTKALVRPVLLSPARISVVRGWPRPGAGAEEEQEDEPFLDDHIETSAPVVDYLTQFSGIQPGDLSVQTSVHTLVPLKVAYKKLRALVDLGATFIGHGLSKDFRIINLFVPHEQVVDTVDLYRYPGVHRKVSLKFLTWFLLRRFIQDRPPPSPSQESSPTLGSPSLAGHDSIEDASAALHLYRTYQHLERSGRLHDTLEDLYETGRRLHWRPPAQD